MGNRRAWEKPGVQEKSLVSRLGHARLCLSARWDAGALATAKAGLREGYYSTAARNLRLPHQLGKVPGYLDAEGVPVEE